MPAKKSILLLGRKGIVVDEARAKLAGLFASNPNPNSNDDSSKDTNTIDDNLQIHAGTSLSDVERVLGTRAAPNHKIDHVFMGAGIELDKRLEIVRAVYERSDTTTVHLKDAASGPKGFLVFVRAVLEGLDGLEEGNWVKEEEKGEKEK